MKVRGSRVKGSRTKVRRSRRGSRRARVKSGNAVIKQHGSLDPKIIINEPGNEELPPIDE